MSSDTHRLVIFQHRLLLHGLHQHAYLSPSLELPLVLGARDRFVHPCADMEVVALYIDVKDSLNNNFPVWDVRGRGTRRA